MIYSPEDLRTVAEAAADTNEAYDALMSEMHDAAGAGNYSYVYTAADTYLRDDFRQRLTDAGFAVGVYDGTNVENPAGLVLKINWTLS